MSTLTMLAVSNDPSPYVSVSPVSTSTALTEKSASVSIASSASVEGSVVTVAAAGVVGAVIVVVGVAAGIAASEFCPASVNPVTAINALTRSPATQYADDFAMPR